MPGLLNSYCTFYLEYPGCPFVVNKEEKKQQQKTYYYQENNTMMQAILDINMKMREYCILSSKHESISTGPCGSGLSCRESFSDLVLSLFLSATVMCKLPC